MPDHVHMCLSVPPKYAVSNVVGYLKGKSAILIARRFGGQRAEESGVIALQAFSRKLRCYDWR
jgi:putative transposase